MADIEFFVERKDHEKKEPVVEVPVPVVAVNPLKFLSDLFFRGKSPYSVVGPRKKKRSYFGKYKKKPWRNYKKKRVFRQYTKKQKAAYWKNKRGKRY